MNHAYTAGLIDGEGTIGISYMNNKSYRSPYVSVSSTTYAIMEYLHKNYGGSISKHKTYKAHHKSAWSWKLTSLAQIKPFLENILPHMLEPAKIKRGNMLLEDYPKVTVRNGKYTPEQREAKLDFETRFLS